MENLILKASSLYRTRSKLRVPTGKSYSQTYQN